MFICTLKASNIKFFAAVLAAVTVLISIIVFSSDVTAQTTDAIAAANEKISFEKVKTNEDRVNFLKQFGWDVNETPKEEVTMKVPAEFDKVMNSYNEIQKNQGLDLSKYKGKEVVRYTYEITNYPDYGGTVYANVIIHKQSSRRRCLLRRRYRIYFGVCDARGKKLRKMIPLYHPR